MEKRKRRREKSKITMTKKHKKSKFTDLNFNLILYILNYLKKGEIFQLLCLDKRINKIIQNNSIFQEFLKFKEIYNQRICLNEKHCKKVCKRGNHGPLCIKDTDFKILDFCDDENSIDELVTQCDFCTNNFCKRCIIRNLYKCCGWKCQRYICKFCVHNMDRCELCKRYCCKSLGSIISDCSINRQCSGCKTTICDYCYFYRRDIIKRRGYFYCNTCWNNWASTKFGK
jgi:hypothetical protein